MTDPDLQIRGGLVSKNFFSDPLQHARKVVSDSPGLVDLAIGLVNSVFNLPDGQVKFQRNSNNRRTVKSILLVKKLLGLVEMKSLLWASIWSKNKRAGRGLPGPLPRIHHWHFVKELPKRFHLKGNTIGFCPQMLKLVKSDKSSSTMSCKDTHAWRFHCSHLHTTMQNVIPPSTMFRKSLLFSLWIKKKF